MSLRKADARLNALHELFASELPQDDTERQALAEIAVRHVRRKSHAASVSAIYEAFRVPLHDTLPTSSQATRSSAASSANELPANLFNGGSLHGLEVDSGQLVVRVMVRFSEEATSIQTDTLSILPISQTIGAGRIILAGLTALADRDDVEFIEMDSFLVPQGFRVPRQHVGTVPRVLGPQSSKVLLGFVDTGIDYRRLNFRDKKGETRIEKLWVFSCDHVHSNPFGVPFGKPKFTEYGRGVINKSIKLTIPEEERPTLPANTSEELHGTYMAAIAAASPRPCPQYEGLVPAAPLAVVAACDSGVGPIGSLPDIAWGTKYIFDAAEARGCPCVVNVSLGDNLGPRDGSTAVERCFSDLVRQDSGRAIVVSTGNKAKRWNTRGRITTPGTKVKRTLSIESDHNDVVVELWLLDDREFKSISFRRKHDGVCAKWPGKNKLVQATDEVSIWFRTAQWKSGKKVRRYASILISAKDSAAEGNWIVEFSTHKGSGPCHWRGAVEINPSAEWKYPNGASSVMTPATAHDVIAVGAVFPNGSGYSLWELSGWGDTDDQRSLPHLCAVGIEAPGPLKGGGCGSDFYESVTGTSVSAAVVSAIAVHELSKAPDTDVATLCKRLMRAADPKVGNRPDNKAAGAGRARFP